MRRSDSGAAQQGWEPVMPIAVAPQMTASRGAHVKSAGPLGELIDNVARVRYAVSLSALSDAELAERGLKREDIVAHAFEMDADRC